MLRPLRHALVLAFLIALPGLAMAQTQDDLRRSIFLVNQEMELLKASLNSGLERVDTNDKALDEAQERLVALQKRVKELSLQLDRQSIESAETANKVDRVKKEVDEKLAKFNFSGGLRVRTVYEANRTDLSSDTDDNDLYFAQRFDLDMLFRPTSKVEIKALLQDNRIWGGANTTIGAEGGDLGFGAAHVLLDDLIAPGLDIQVGRMGLSYGSERMIGADDWNGTGNSFDGVRISYAVMKDLVVDALYAVVRERNAIDGEDTSLSGLYATYTVLPKLDVDAYVLHLYDGMDASYKNVATIGVAARGTLFDALYLDLEGAVQLGRAAEPLYNYKNSHLATAGFAELGYTQGGDVPFELGLFATGASGDAEPREIDGNDRSVSFIPLFPSTHKYWGAMDRVAWTNLMSFGLKGSVTPIPVLKILLQYHEFYVADDQAPLPGIGRSPNPTIEPMGSHIAREVDVALKVSGLDWAGVQLGYSVLLPLDGAKNYKGLDQADAAHWLYLQANLTF
jgi:hypothetical protein